MIDLLGWSGAVLVLVSYAQYETSRLRRISLAAGCLFIAYDVAIAAWPAVTMEVALIGINVRRLMQAGRAARQRRPVLFRRVDAGLRVDS